MNNKNAFRELYEDKQAKTLFGLTKILAVILTVFLLHICLISKIEAQEVIQKPDDVFKTEWIAPEIIERFSIQKTPQMQPELLTEKKVRFVYLIPADKTYKEEYKAAIADAALHLQDFYQKEMGNGTTFTLNNPIVEVYQTSNTASWYSTNPRGGYASWFVNNTLWDGFAATGGYLGDPNNRWLFYIDADLACGQGIGANGNPTSGGWAVLAANDLRGLTGLENVPECGGNPDRGGKYRWIGGLGHELAHTWDLPHPPGCEQGNCQGGQTAYNSLMWIGYAYYPNTYLLAENKQQLAATGYFSVLDLRAPQFVDFENDRKADFSVWRPADGLWSVLLSSNGSPSYVGWGLNEDKIVPGDYDGDGKTDSAVWRPSEGIWYILPSFTNIPYTEQLGTSGDVPIAADYDGDRRTDIAVWQPTSRTWLIKRSATNTLLTFQFGDSQDIPVPADYNGDKRTDIAVYRRGINAWQIYNYYLSYFYANPQINVTTTYLGSRGDKLVPADYDGDKKADISIWRPAKQIWSFIGSSSGNTTSRRFGMNGDIAAPADYDNDGKTDFAIWRPNEGVFYIIRSSDGILQTAQWGVNGEIPVASAYVR